MRGMAAEAACACHDHRIRQAHAMTNGREGACDDHLVRQAPRWPPSATVSRRPSASATGTRD